MRTLRFVALLLAASTPAQTPAQAPASDAIQLQATAYVQAAAPARAEPGQVVAALLDALAKDPAAPTGEPLVSAITDGLRDLADRGPVVERLRQLAGQDSIHGLTRLRIRYTVAREDEAYGRLEQADALDPDGEFAKSFMVAGPFGDGGTYFHHVVFAPEQGQLDPGVAMNGRFGRVFWSPVVRAPGRPTTRIERRGPHHEGCYYALHQVDAKAARPAWLSLTTNGSVEVFVNGTRVLDVDRLTQHRTWRLMVPANLRKGRNHVMVKATSPWSTGFSLRYCDDRGRTLTDVTEEAQGRIVRAAAAEQAEPAVAPFVDAAAAWTAAGDKGKSPMIDAALGLLLLNDGVPSQGLEALDRAASAMPDDAAIQMALATGLANARHLPADVIRQRRRAAIDKVLALDKQHDNARVEMAEILAGDDKKEDAVRQLAEVVEQRPAFLAARRSLIDVYGGLNWKLEAERLADATLQKFPADRELFQRSVRRLIQAGNFPLAEQKVRERLAVMPGDAGTLNELQDILRRTERAAAAHDVVLKINRRDPEDFDVLLQRAALLARSPATRAQAKKLLELAQTKDPAAPTPFEKLASVCLLDGDREAARGFLRRALERNPSDRKLRERVRRMDNPDADDDYPEMAPWRPDAEALVRDFKPRPGDEASVTTLVLDHEILRVFEDGSTVEEVHQIRRINDRQGVEAREEAQRAAGADELLTVRTIGADGKSYVPTRVEGSLSMPRLAPGAFIEERYRNHHGGPDAGPLRLTTFYFQSQDEPFVLSRLVVLFPKDFARGRFLLRNFGPLPKPIEKDGLVAYVFEKRDMPRIVEEENAPPLTELVPWLTYGEDGSFGEFARETRVSLERQTRGSREVDRATADVTAGKTGDAQKVAAINAFVQREIPDVGGQSDPTSILIKKEGNRWFLFVAMLRAADVPFEFAIFRPYSPETDPQPEPLFAGDAYYQRPAVHVRPRDGAPVWSFLGTPRYAPLGSLITGGNSTMERARGLLIGGDSPVPVSLPGVDPLELGLMAFAERVTLKKGGAGEIVASVHFHGIAGWGIREQLKGAPEQARKVGASQFAQQFFPGWTLRKIDFVGLEDDGQPLRIEASLFRRRALETVGDSLALPLLLDKVDLTKSMAGKGERVHPFVYHGYETSDVTMVLDPGEDYRVVAPPSSLLVRKHLLDYGLSFSMRGEQLVVRRRMILRPGRIEPRDFGEWQSICRSVDDAEQQRILLVERK